MRHLILVHLLLVYFIDTYSDAVEGKYYSLSSEELGCSDCHYNYIIGVLKKDSNERSDYSIIMQPIKEAEHLVFCNSSAHLCSLFLSGLFPPFICSYKNSKLYINQSGLIFGSYPNEPVFITGSELYLSSLKVFFSDDFNRLISSLINAESGADVDISQLSLDNMMVREGKTSVCEGELNSLRLRMSHFSNITWNVFDNKKNEKMNKKKKEKRNSCSSLITEGCSVIGCENPYYGCITFSDNLLYSTTSNSSFSDCFSISQTIKERGSYVSTTVNFNDCYFFNINGIDCNGGALDLFSCSAIVKCCSFFYCSSRYKNNSKLSSGGAIYCYDGSIVVSYSNFSQCSSTAMGTFIAIHFTSETYLFNCMFYDCNGSRLGAVFLTDFYDLTLSSCYFSNITQTQNGAALYLDTRMDHDCISDCSFSSVKVDGTCGNIYFYLENYEILFSISFCKFMGVSTASSICYKSMYDFDTDTLKNTVRYCYSDCFEDGLKYYKLTVENEVLIFSFDLGELEDGPLVVISSYESSMTDKTDNNNNNNNNNIHRTVKEALFYASKDNIIINIVSEAEKDTRLVLFYQNVTVCSEEHKSVETRTKLRLMDDNSSCWALVYLEAGSLIMKNLYVFINESNKCTSKSEFCVLASSSSSLTIDSCTVCSNYELSGEVKINRDSSLFFVTFGHLSLKDSYFSSFYLNSHSLIDFYYINESLSFNNDISSCSFNNIELSYGNYSVLSSEHPSLSDNFTFNNCSCKEGCGGGIYLSFIKHKSHNIGNTYNASVFNNCSSYGESEYNGRGGAVFINFENAEDENIYFTNIIFTNNTALSGSNVFIFCENVNSFKSNFFYECVIDYGYEEKYAMAREISGTEDVNLYYFWVSKYEEVYLGEEGIDGFICGRKDILCSSINEGVKHLEKGSKIYIIDKGILSDIVSCDYLEVLSTSKENKVELITKLPDKLESSEIKGDGLIVGVMDMTFMNIIYKCEKNIGYNSFIMEDRGKLNLTKCEFVNSDNDNIDNIDNNEESERSINYNFINIKKGELIINDFKMNSIIFEKEFIILGESLLKANITQIEINDSCLDYGFMKINYNENNKEVIIENMIINNLSLSSPFLFIPSNFYNSQDVILNILTLNNCHFKNIAQKERGCSILLLSQTSVKLNIIWNDVDLIYNNNNNNKLVGPFLEISSSSSSFNSCSFIGIEAKEEAIVKENNKDICSWNDYILSFYGGSAYFNNCRISNSSKGGMMIKEGCNATFINSYFNGNNPKFANFKSLERNIICNDSIIDGEKIIEKETDCLWILSNNCSFNKEFNNYVSVLFIPEIDNIALTKDKEKNEIIISVNGKYLFPCYTSYFIEGKGSSYYLNCSDSFIPEKETEANIILTNQNDKNNILNIFHFNVTLIFPDGKGGNYYKTYSFDEEETDGSDNPNITDPSNPDTNKTDNQNVVKSEGVGNNMYFWITAGVIVLLLLILIIITIYICCLICLKRKKKKKEVKEVEMSESSDPEYTQNALFIESYNPYGDEERHIYSGKGHLGKLIDAFSCDDPYDKVYVDIKQSLSSHMSSFRSSSDYFHSSNPKEREEVAAHVCFEVVNGMLHFFSKKEGKRIALHLSPKTIILGEKGAVYLVHIRNGTEEERKMIPKSELPVLSQLKESERWAAPEIINKTQEMNRNSVYGEIEGKNVEEIEKIITEKSVVFTIGMILYQLLSLNEPFSEFDITSAEVKIMKGERPVMDTFIHNHLKACSIIKRCWSMNSEERLSLKGLKRELMGLLPEFKSEMGKDDNDSDSDYDSQSD